MPTAYINIGSNKGDRLAYIEQSVALIEHLCQCQARRATLVKSSPWGYYSDNEYLNLGIAVETAIEPLHLMTRLLEIERSISTDCHRDKYGNYVDRCIDIDLIAIDDIVIESAKLTLPHPRMHLREFVLLPMDELVPDWVHPIFLLTPRQMLDKLSANHFF